MMPEQGGELFERARSGDRDALNELLLRHRARLERTARSLLGEELRTRVRTSDILQSTFVEVLSSVREFRGTNEEAFANWVARILQNNVNDAAKFHAARKRARSRESSRQDLDTLGVSASGPTPSSEAAFSDELYLVGRALQQLSEDYRRVILLRLRPGATHQEVARVLDRTPGATRVLLARARAALLIEIDRLRQGDG